MQSYYFTFMQRQAFKNYYAQVTAHDEKEAREAMFEHFGDKWFTSYADEKKFDEQIRQFSLTCLIHIKVQRHGDPKHYSSVSYEIVPDKPESDLYIRYLGVLGLLARASRWVDGNDSEEMECIETAMAEACANHSHLEYKRLTAGQGFDIGVKR